MVDLPTQIDAGWLVCPRTRRRLVIDASGERLTTQDGTTEYPLVDGRVPVLLDAAWAQAYAAGSPTMLAEYAERETSTRAGRRRALALLRGALSRLTAADHRTPASVAAFQRVIADQPADALCLSVGGGPQREHPNLVNLNVGAFPSVDVVADAHALPYANGSVRAVFCEAVLEHLADPARAVAEMHRVLEAGGAVYAATPFLHGYHGYPHHYQNFTLTGHAELFTARGFEVEESGTCVGPVYALTTLLAIFMAEYIPGGRGLALAWRIFASVALNPLDRMLNRRPDAHVLASTTYVVARKPAAGQTPGTASPSQQPAGPAPAR